MRSTFPENSLLLAFTQNTYSSLTKFETCRNEYQSTSNTKLVWSSWVQHNSWLLTKSNNWPTRENVLLSELYFSKSFSTWVVWSLIWSPSWFLRRCGCDLRPFDGWKPGKVSCKRLTLYSSHRWENVDLFVVTALYLYLYLYFRHHASMRNVDLYVMTALLPAWATWLTAPKAPPHHLFIKSRHQ